MGRQDSADSSPSLFISIEGGECTGKTTQAQLLYERLMADGRKAKMVREPGSTPLAQYLRQWLKGSPGANHPLNHRSELFLFAAARADLVTTVSCSTPG